MSTPEYSVSGAASQPVIADHNAEQPYRQRRIAYPPGNLGRLAHYLWRYAHMPVDDYSIATAIGFYAGICGRGWGINSTGLNHDIIVLGRSGTGKNIVHQGIANIANQLNGTPITEFISNARMASSPALIKFVTKKPSCVQQIGEVGQLYQEYSKCKYNDPIHQLFTTKLDMWERSGPDGMAVGIAYSDAEKNVETEGVGRIAHSTLGESVAETFYDALNNKMMAQGFMSRLWIFEYDGEEPEDSTDRKEILDEDVLASLRALVQEASQRRYRRQQQVAISPEAAVVFKQVLSNCKDEKSLAGKDEAIRQLWARGYEKVLRLAALCAVADNHLSPTVSVEHAEWAYSMLSRSNENLITRIGEDIADDDDHTREQMILDRCRRWLGSPRKDPKEEALRQKHIVTRRFLQQEVTPKKIFKGHRGGAVFSLDITMRSLCDQGFLEEPKPNTVKVPGTNVWDQKPEEQPLKGKCWRIINWARP